MEEIWKDVKGYEGLYEISNLGNVKSIERLIIRSGHKMRIKEHILSKYIGNHGYYVVSIWKNNIGTSLLVHRIVAEAFIKNIELLPCINHKNGIRIDNRVENLEWCTYSQNNTHSFRVLRRKQNFEGKFGKDNPRHKLILQYDLNGNFIQSFYGIQEASRELGINAGMICRVCRGQRNHTKGFVFKYN